MSYLRNDRLEKLQALRRVVQDDNCLYFALCAAIDVYQGNESALEYSKESCQKFKRESV